MALTVHALCALATVKTELTISGSADDTYLERLIEAVSAEIERYCRRHFEWNAAIVEKIVGHGTEFLAIAQPPINTITSITYAGTTVASADYEIYGDGGSGLIYAPGGWVWTAQLLPGLIVERPLPGSERKYYTVTYKGGYVTQPQKDADATLTKSIPLEVEDAAIELVANRYRMKGANRSIKSERIMSVSMDYDRSSLSQGIKERLTPWRRLGIAA